MLTSSTARVDPRVTRTRKLLIEAFLTLMAEKPFEAITIQDITTRATVNRATFYAHFTDKYALVDELIRDGFAQILQERLVAPAVAVQAHLRRLFLAVTDHWTAINGRCQHSYRVFEPLVEAQVKGQLRDSIRRLLLEQAAPQARSRQQVELVATIVSSGLYAAALLWSQSSGTQTADAFADAAIPLIAASITALDASPTH
jgi:AcrR family transcriptional regulator